MKRMIGHWLALSALTLILVHPARALSVAPEVPSRIFILHSYEEHHVCGQPQQDGVLAALKKAGFKDNDNLQIVSYFMDTKRKNNTPELIEAQARIALQNIGAFQPHVVVILDDNAFRTVALHLVDTPIAIVFSGLNGQPEDYNLKKKFMRSRLQPGQNITGVYEKLHIADAVRVHSRLFKNRGKVRIFVDTSPTGRAIAKQIGLEMAREGTAGTWDMQVVASWEAYQHEIHAVNAASDVSAIYPAALLLKDGNGQTYTAPQIFAWTIQNSGKPEIALNYAFTRMGLFGGAAVDFYAMGTQAGEMVVRILQGEDVGNIGIEEADRYALVFNMERAKQLGITIPSDILMAADEVVTTNR